MGKKFEPGNRAARGRRKPVRTTAAFIELIDEKLRAHGVDDGRSVLDYAAEAMLHVITAASKGDLESCRWLSDRFYPAERELVAVRGRWPSPTKQPLEYLEALGKAVRKNELSTAQAARLGNLVRPLIADARVTEIEQKLHELEQKLGDRDRRLRSGSGTAPQVIKLVQ